MRSSAAVNSLELKAFLVCSTTERLAANSLQSQSQPQPSKFIEGKVPDVSWNQLDIEPMSNLSGENRRKRSGGKSLGAKRYAENAKPIAIPDENANLRPLAQDVHDAVLLCFFSFEDALISLGNGSFGDELDAPPVETCVLLTAGLL